MNNKILLICTIFLLSFGASSAEWRVYASCDDGSAVLDKNNLLEGEFQLVIRNRQIVDYFEQIGANHANGRGEAITLLTQQSEYSWSKISDRNIEYLVGRYYNQLIYQVYEGTISPNGKWMRGQMFADWIFRNCQ